ncbi:hypothetical protein K503DRAFT_637350 [Rhizopogon vinicolor AM-OR11-026]|uniref:Uncharacterized protein n=1 Tax=Rhizopogon vinicolor AM-OR11-026 TaxID=1314800 RepID=A0A1B7MHN2_9AGAM|nr:hypothetical protein K503DRAFT_637350 [Rhizopogon vinicolor AM-OR11-026]
MAERQIKLTSTSADSMLENYRTGSMCTHSACAYLSQIMGYALSYATLGFTLRHYLRLANFQVMTNASPISDIPHVVECLGKCVGIGTCIGFDARADRSIRSVMVCKTDRGLLEVIIHRFITDRLFSISVVLF